MAVVRFHLNERKAAQAAAYLLKRHDGVYPYMSLIKLLYLADRRALIETGWPITGDRLVSMPYGPVLSVVLDLIHYGPRGCSPWFEYVSEPEGYDVRVKSSCPEFDALSQYDRQLLDATDTQYGQLSKWALVDLCHSLPEWKDPEGSSITIDPADILRVADIPEEEILEMARAAREHAHLAEFGLGP